MDFFEAVETRRSVRRYLSEPVPETVIRKALKAALLAPNSSNLQTWGFYWVRSAENKAKLIKACLSQGAAKSAQELVVVVANPTLWKRNCQELLRVFALKNAPPIVYPYYKKLVPFQYAYGWLAPFKWILFNVIGLFRPMARRPWSRRDIDEVSIKSAALAAENFMLAISAQGFDSCPMEGFDEFRVKKLLKLSCRPRIVMVISIGKRDPQKGIWGERVRMPEEWAVHEI